MDNVTAKISINLYNLLSVSVLSDLKNKGNLVSNVKFSIVESALLLTKNRYASFVEITKFY